MLTLLPTELRMLIFQYLSREELIIVALIDKSMYKEIKSLLLTKLNLSSSIQVKSLLNLINKSNGQLNSIIKSLTLNGRRINDNLSTSINCIKKQKSSNVIISEITANDLVSLLSQFTLEELHLKELSFNSLRRRQLELNSSTFALKKLTIFGRLHSNSNSINSAKEEDGFNLYTTGSILNQLPLLTHLALRNIKQMPSAFDNLPPPTFKLKSLALIGELSTANSFTSSQYKWLFHSTAWAESLKDLILEWNNNSPKILNSIRYLVIRVENFYLKSNQSRVIENFLLHFPSLLHFTFNSYVHPVDFRRLIWNLELPLLSIFDYSPNLSKTKFGLNSRDLALVLSKRDKVESLKFARNIRSITINSDEMDSSSSKLKEVCEEKGIKLNFLKAWSRDVDDWIPNL